jgi:hypothetical protein
LGSASGLRSGSGSESASSSGSALYPSQIPPATLAGGATATAAAGATVTAAAGATATAAAAAAAAEEKKLSTRANRCTGTELSQLC